MFTSLGQARTAAENLIQCVYYTVRDIFRFRLNCDFSATALEYLHKSTSRNGGTTDVTQPPHEFFAPSSSDHLRFFTMAGSATQGGTVPSLSNYDIPSISSTSKLQHGESNWSAVHQQQQEIKYTICQIGHPSSTAIRKRAYVPRIKT